MTKQELLQRIIDIDKWLDLHRHLDNWEKVQEYHYRLKALYYRNTITN